MASPLRLSVHGLDERAAAEGWEAVRDEFEACEQAMSRFRETSGITVANRASARGQRAPVEPRLRHALVAADRARRVTAGRFDARRVGDLDRLGYPGAPIGTASVAGEGHGEPELVAADAGPRPPVALERDRTVLLDAPVDLGGIGKGLALRWSGAILRGRLPESGGALLEAGGDVVAVGPAPDGEAWLVGIEDPRGGDAPLAVVALLDAAVATSSVAVHRWTTEGGRPVHHLLDPATGEPGGEGLLAVTVVGPDPAWAEVRTKQLFLAGRAGIAGLARSLGLPAWWVGEDGTLSMTPGARLLTAWTTAGA